MHCCQRSARAGVKPGITVAQARALLGRTDLRLAPHEPAREADALHALAEWALRYSPMVAPDPPDGLLVDLTGTQRLHGGDRALARRVIGEVGRLGFGATAAVAPTFAAARALARFHRGARRGLVVDDDRLPDALRTLPIEGLALDADVLDALHEINADRVGDVLDLPRADLHARFGEALLLRLDQATGSAIETIEPVRPVTPAYVERLLAGPTTNYRGVHLAARRLLDRLADVLLHRECGAARFVFECEHPDRAIQHITVTLGHASRDARHIWRLLEPKLELLNMRDGIERLGLTAERLAPLPHRQAERFGDDATTDRAATDAFDQLLDCVANRLGWRRLARPQPVESHLPQRAFRLRPALEPMARDAFAAQLTTDDRPSVLLAQPEPVDVIAAAPEGPPRWLRWRGNEHPVAAALGPLRLAPEWWRGNGACMPPLDRDYFKLQLDDGRWLWLYRVVGQSRWFVHGQWV